MSVEDTLHKRHIIFSELQGTVLGVPVNPRAGSATGATDWRTIAGLDELSSARRC